MSWLAWGGSAALIAILASCWRYVRTIWSQVASRVVVNVTVYDQPSTGLLAYLVEHMQQSRFGPRTYVGRRTFVRPRLLFEAVAGEYMGHGTLLFWKGWKPLWVTRTSAGGANDQSAVIHRPVQLMFFRWMFDADALIQTATEHFNAHNQTQDDSRYRVYHCHGTAGKPVQLRGIALQDNPQGIRNGALGFEEFLGVRLLRWTLKDLGPLRHERGCALDDVAMSPEMQELWNTIQRWHKSREWFLERGLPWKFGAQLYGPPGTGKTMLVRAIAEELNLPVFSFDLATFFNDELREAWQNIRSSTPAIVLIEDIDGVFHGRAPANDKIQLTFDALLNCIDGVERTDGLLLFITTNKIETLDPALGGFTDERRQTTSRPGRIDCSVMFGPPSAAGREQIARRILKDWPAEIGPLVMATADLTGAQVERRCINLAQKLLRENGHVLPISHYQPSPKLSPQERYDVGDLPAER